MNCLGFCDHQEMLKTEKVKDGGVALRLSLGFMFLAKFWNLASKILWTRSRKCVQHPPASYGPSWHCGNSPAQCRDNWPREARLTHSLPFLVRGVSQTWHTADELGDKTVRNDRGQCRNDLSRRISLSKQTKIVSISSSNSCNKYRSKCKLSNLCFFLAKKYLHNKNYVRNNTKGRGLIW